MSDHQSVKCSTIMTRSSKRKLNQVNDSKHTSGEQELVKQTKPLWFAKQVQLFLRLAHETVNLNKLHFKS
jgi:hypothetical protein